MAEEQKDKKRLIEGILDDARKEAGKIRKEADRSIEDRKKSVDVSIKRACQDAEERAKNQIAEIERQTEVAVSSAERRQELRLQKEVSAHVENEVKKRLADLVDTPRYEQIVTGWIVEAAIGLNVPEAIVHASKRELPIVEKVLPEAEKTVGRLTGRSITLRLETENPETAQGILLADVDGKTAFNNQVSTRLLRYRNRIRTMIHNRLFKESS